MSTLAKNVPQVVYYQKQMGDFGAIFVRKHPLAPGLYSYTMQLTGVMCASLLATWGSPDFTTLLKFIMYNFVFLYYVK